MLVLVVWYWPFLSFLSPIRTPVPPVVVAVPRSYTYSAEQRFCFSVFLAVRCRLTPIAHGGLSFYRLGTLQWPQCCSGKCCNSSSRSAHTAVFTSPTTPTASKAVSLVDRSSSIVCRLASFNLYGERCICRLIQCARAKFFGWLLGTQQGPWIARNWNTSSNFSVQFSTWYAQNFTFFVGLSSDVFFVILLLFILASRTSPPSSTIVKSSNAGSVGTFKKMFARITLSTHNPSSLLSI